MSRPKGKGETPKRHRGDKASTRLRDALKSPVAVSGLSMTAFAAPVQRTPPRTTPMAMAHRDRRHQTAIQGRTPDGLFVNDLEISLYARGTAKGKIKDGARDVINLRLRPQTHDLVSKGTFRIIRRIQIPPGKYQLRIGVREANGGRLGTVLYDLDAPDFSKGPLVMSGIAHDVRRRQHESRPPAPIRRSTRFKDVLPAPPTASREFAPQRRTGHLRRGLRQHRSHRAPGRDHSTVLADNGKTVFTNVGRRAARSCRARRAATDTRPDPAVADWRPGRYVLRVEAKSMLGNSEPVKREVEFRVR